MRHLRAEKCAFPTFLARQITIATPIFVPRIFCSTLSCQPLLYPTYPHKAKMMKMYRTSWPPSCASSSSCFKPLSPATGRQLSMSNCGWWILFAGAYLPWWYPQHPLQPVAHKQCQHHLVGNPGGTPPRCPRRSSCLTHSVHRHQQRFHRHLTSQHEPMIQVDERHAKR